MTAHALDFRGEGLPASILEARARLSRRQREVLTLMAEAADAEEYDLGEIAVEGMKAWLDDTRIHAGTVRALLLAVVISTTGDSDPHGVQRYVINEDGRLLVKTWGGA